jgi:hypothetical protein
MTQLARFHPDHLYLRQIWWQLRSSFVMTTQHSLQCLERLLIALQQRFRPLKERMKLMPQLARLSLLQFPALQALSNTHQLIKSGMTGLEPVELGQQLHF